MRQAQARTKSGKQKRIFQIEHILDIPVNMKNQYSDYAKIVFGPASQND
jgi:hypothetical protein